MVRAKSMAQIQFDERHNKRGRITKNIFKSLAKKNNKRNKQGGKGKTDIEGNEGRKQIKWSDKN